MQVCVSLWTVPHSHVYSIGGNKLYMEEKEQGKYKNTHLLDDTAAEQVAGGREGLTCRRCGCHLSVIKWRDYGGYCMKCSQILRKERMGK